MYWRIGFGFGDEVAIKITVNTGYSELKWNWICTDQHKGKQFELYDRMKKRILGGGGMRLGNGSLYAYVTYGGKLNAPFCRVLLVCRPLL